MGEKKRTTTLTPKESGQSVFDAARLLNVSDITVYTYIKDFPDLSEYVKKERRGRKQYIRIPNMAVFCKAVHHYVYGEPQPEMVNNSKTYTL